MKIKLALISAVLCNVPASLLSGEIGFNAFFTNGIPRLSNESGGPPTVPPPVAVSDIAASNGEGYHFLDSGQTQILDLYSPGDYFEFAITPLDPYSAVSFDSGGFWLGFYGSPQGPSSFEIQAINGNTLESFPVVFSGHGGVIDTRVPFGVMPPGTTTIRLVGLGGSANSADGYGISYVTFGAKVTSIPEPSTCVLMMAFAAGSVCLMRCRAAGSRSTKIE